MCLRSGHIEDYDQYKPEKKRKTCKNEPFGIVRIKAADEGTCSIIVFTLSLCPISVNFAQT